MRAGFSPKARIAIRLSALALCPFFSVAFAASPLSVTDDAGHAVTLPSPAQRIVSLAPHTTELLFAAGAGSKVVGVSEYSDYPPQAARIASVGGATSPDMERLIALKPDLIVAWHSGNAAAHFTRLRALGIPVFESEPRKFEDIASSLERLSHLAGTDAIGKTSARDFRARLQKLSLRYRDRAPVTVFYQIWHDPLMTLNGDHLISSAIRLCGGRNVFGGLPQLTPMVDIEAVLKQNPETIISGNDGGGDVFASWRRYPQLNAVARGNLFTIESDLLTRGGPRMVDGTEALCRRLDEARAKGNPGFLSVKSP